MYFRILHDEMSGELSYLLADLDAREAVVIDPHEGDVLLVQALLAERELRLRWVLRTHHHEPLMPRAPSHWMSFGAPVLQGDSGSEVSMAHDGQVLTFGNELVHVVATPGHTPCCLSFGWRDRLFCGGLLAVDACPHQPYPAAPDALWDSVKEKVFTLPDETLLFCGHEQLGRAVSTVQEQRRWHPFFSALSRDEFLSRISELPRNP